MSDDGDDIKDLLGRAIGAEPPLRLDRDEVVRTGRKRLRQRWALEAGGVVAAVVVAVVGASVLSGVVGSGSEEERLPPAATSTSSHPGPYPGIDLPLTPDPTTEGAALTREHANQLTQRLFASSTITQLGALTATEGGGDVLAFRVKSGTYVFDADVVAGRTDGALQVSVEPARAGEETGCELVPTPYDLCEVADGVAVARWKDGTGEKKLLVVVVQDGSKVAAVATNISSRQRADGKAPDGRDPVLGVGSLTKLVRYAGLTAA
jgi:hypothetical protein